MVGLVDDDEAQRRQETRPPLVRRQHHVVQEIGVRQDQVSARACPLLRLARRVPVHRRRAHTSQPLIDEAGAPFRGGLPSCDVRFVVLAEQRHERGQLIRRQSLRRSQVQGGWAAANCGNTRRILGLHQVGEDRRPRGQRLARAGPRREHDIAALAHSIQGLALMNPRALHAPMRPRAHDRRRHPLRPIRDPPLPPRQGHVAEQPIIPRAQALQDRQQVGGGGRRGEARRGSAVRPCPIIRLPSR